MPWKVKDLMSQRYEFCHLALEPGARISDLCQEFGISRKTGHKWLKRYREGGELADASRRPHHSPGRTAAAVEAQVVALRQEFPYWGPRKLRRVLQDRHPAKQWPAVGTVARILKRQGLSASGPPLQRPVDWQRFAWPRPNDLWQMDLKAPLRLPDRGKIYPVGLLDDHSRYLLGLWVMPEATDDGVLFCWAQAARQYGLPGRTLTDHGPQFRMEDHQTSAFRVYLWACGVHHTQGRLAHPQTQGKIERLWRTLNLEVFRRHEYQDLVSWQSCLDDWRQHYNQVRPHQELADEVPACHYHRSEREFSEPDRHAYSPRPGSLPRRVNDRGWVSLGGQRVMVGRGFAGWTVEARPLGDGCWHFYFKDHFIRECLLTPKRVG